jgi:hypothetical protein
MQKITPFLWYDNNAEEAVKSLYFDLQKLEDHRHHALRRCRTGAEGICHDDRFPTRGPGLHRAERRSNVQVHRSHIPVGRLQDSNYPPAASRGSAAGSRTSSACRGKSFRLPWSRCCKTKMPKNRTESCKP